jgi:hypothetical protein
LLLKTFVPKGPVLLGVDDSIERRRGKRISAEAGVCGHRAHAGGSSARKAADFLGFCRGRR